MIFKGIPELESLNATKVTVVSKDSFMVDVDTTRIAIPTNSRMEFVQVKMPQIVNFVCFMSKQQKPLSEALQIPEFFTVDFAKMDHPSQLHIGFQALDFFKVKAGKDPRPRNDQDAVEFLKIANEINKNTKAPVEKIDEVLLKELAYQSRGRLAPMASVIGSISAQEVLKACSGKFFPIKQFMYFDSIESLPKDVTLSEHECSPIGSRYDSQIGVFGKSFQQKLANSTHFLVGAGAIGCGLIFLIEKC